MCYWEGSVITNVLAAWLFGVTVKIFLLISPRRLGGGPEHEDAEDKQDGQPHLQSKRNLGKRPHQGDAQLYMQTMLLSDFSVFMSICLLPGGQIGEMSTTVFFRSYLSNRGGVLLHLLQEVSQ